MIVKVHYHQETEINGVPCDHIEMTECDEVRVHKGKGIVRIIMYKDSKCIGNCEYHDRILIFIMEKGKTVDRIELTGQKTKTKKNKK